MYVRWVDGCYNVHRNLSQTGSRYKRIKVSGRPGQKNETEFQESSSGSEARWWIRSIHHFDSVNEKITQLPRKDCILKKEREELLQQHKRDSRMAKEQRDQRYQR
jgi:hypothetical protein